jgi:allophanate hydrolase subunit 1
MKSKYDPILKVMPRTEYRDEVLFRTAGDEFVEVAYGRSETDMELHDKLLYVFRTLVVNDRVKRTNLRGLEETAPGARTNLYRFDPLAISMEELVEEISKVESEVETIEDSVLETRLVRMPLSFDDSEMRKHIERYVREIKPGSVDCENGSNLNYIARYNGIGVDELKRKVLQTEWFTITLCFYPGVPLCLPLDPRCAVTAPKCNPSRTSTAEGTVDLADSLTSIFSVPSPGGYQLLGRTGPILQTSQKHSQFKESPALLRSTDLIQYYEVSENELNEIYEAVEKGSGWEYRIEPRTFSLQEWLRFNEQVKGEAAEFRKKQEYGRRNTPVP